jgi:hypothetical protein
VSDHPARRQWATLETIHDVVYFDPGVRDAGVGLGLRGFWMAYFAFRAAPLGAVGAEPVIACFAGFEPGTVAKALPDAWSRTTPEACLDARRSVSVDAPVTSTPLFPPSRDGAPVAVLRSGLYWRQLAGRLPVDRHAEDIPPIGP